MIAKWIEDPMPVWEKIRGRLSDQYGELVHDGEFVGVFDGNRLVGAFMVKRWTSHCFEVHGGIDPEYYGRGPEICDVFGRVIFQSTPCLKIVAIIPEFNRLMRRCVQSIGMYQEGVIKKGFMKFSRMHDLYVYGISKSDVFKGGLRCQ